MERIKGTFADMYNIKIIFIKSSEGKSLTSATYASSNIVPAVCFGIFSLTDTHYSG